MEQIKKYFLNIYRIIIKREVRILPGHLAFFLVLSIMPIITLISYVASLFSFSMVDVISVISQFIPTEVEKLITPLLTSGSNLSIVWMIIGFFIASNGTHSIILISNMLYDIQDRNYVSRRIKAFLILVMLMTIFAFILIFLGFGNMILKFILNLNLIPNISSFIYYLFIYIKYPVAFVLTYFFIKATYVMAPDKRISSHYVKKGALFTTIGWIVVTSIYSYYANNLANYDLWYGSLSNIIVLMIWIYIISYIFVLGIAINVNEYHYDEKENKKIEF